MYVIRKAQEHQRNVELHLYRKVDLLVRPSIRELSWSRVKNKINQHFRVKYVIIRSCHHEDASLALWALFFSFPQSPFFYFTFFTSTSFYLPRLYFILLYTSLSLFTSFSSISFITLFFPLQNYLSFLYSSFILR